LLWRDEVPGPSKIKLAMVMWGSSIGICVVMGVHVKGWNLELCLVRALMFWKKVDVFEVQSECVQWKMFILLQREWSIRCWERVCVSPLRWQRRVGTHLKCVELPLV
jgi:hypothetical protein